MTFSDFAKCHGLLIKHLDVGKITRCATENHPRKMNGAFYYDHDFGWCQDWSQHDEPIIWKSEKVRTEAEIAAFDRRIAESRKQQAKERAELARKASLKAHSLINAATISTHNYYRSKQLPEALGLVLPEGELILPMRDCQSDSLSGAQVIKWVDDKWEKKMIYGTSAKGAIFRIGNKSAGTSILCEGMATGHSISMAIKMLCMDACVVVCFSASNMVQVASFIGSQKMIFADNDASNTGRDAAKKTGLPYCMADTIGHDANDLHVSDGLMAVCKKIMDCRKQL